MTSPKREDNKTTVVFDKIINISKLTKFINPQIQEFRKIKVQKM